jgi:hypothetical protein
MKFSLILNSRGRSDYLYNLLASIHNTTANLNDIEVLCSCDNDDIDTYNAVVRDFGLNGSLISQFPFAKFEFIDRERNLIKRFNRMAKICQGRYIFVLNDDVQILTKDWDIIAWNQLDVVSDNIIYGHVRDNSCDKEYHAEYSSFPIISKKAVEALGFFMPDFICGLGGDVVIWRIYDAVGRIVNLDIDLRHILHETVERVVNPDMTAHEMRQNTYANPVDIWGCDLSEHIERLRTAIGHSIC